MISTRQARTIAKAITSAQAKHDAQLAAKHISEAIKLGGADTELVVKYVGLEYKLAQRLKRVCDDVEACPANEFHKRYNIVWSVTRWAEHGESVSTRYYVRSATSAAQLANELAPQENHSDYSPTGQWFRGSPSVRKLDRLGRWFIVHTSSHLDC